MTSTEYKAKIPAGVAAAAGWPVGWGVLGSVSAPVGRRPRGLRRCLPGRGVAPAEEGGEGKEQLAFGARGDERLAGRRKRQPAKSEVPSSGPAELCLRPAIPWGWGAQREWLKMER